MSARAWRRLRLTSQVAFFGLFVWLILQAAFHGSFQLAGGEVRLPYPVSLFLEADPFVALVTALSTGTLYRHLWWALLLIVGTLFLGRFFCGWICPFGSLHHFFGSFKSEKKRGARLIASNRYQRWQAWKYYLLAAALVAALFGSAAGGLLDPISLLVRGLAITVLPATSLAFNAAFDALYATEIRAFRLVADGLSMLLQGWLVASKQPHVRQAEVVGLVFVFLLVLNLRITRLWCRALCPLGALLGVLSRWSFLTLVKDHSRCDDCRRCLLRCQGGDDPIPGAAWRKAECHLCLNCTSECPTGGLSFRFRTSVPAADRRETPELQRRKLVAGLAAGAGLVPLLRATPALAREPDARLIRPPGSLDEPHFLERCIRCGACMKVCPNNALHPAAFEAGLEGLWSPVLVPRIGYCEPSCVLCGQVCPTGAIWEITQDEKLGKPSGRAAVPSDPGDVSVAPEEAAHESIPAPTPTAGVPDQGVAAGAVAESAAVLPEPIKIGTAFYDRGRCLPWAMATECIVCEEWCPTSPKAIYLVAAEVPDARGVARPVRQPYVDPRLCIGCGACEYACPVRDRPAIYVTSIGETRSKVNQFLLQRPPRRVR
jgi:polyferredoxin